MFTLGGVCANFQDGRRSVHRLFEPLWIVAIPILTRKTFLDSLHHGAMAWQNILITVIGRVPEFGANECPGTVGIDTFGGHNDDAAWHFAINRERSAKLTIDPDGRASVNSEHSAYAWNEKKQRDARIVYYVSQSIDAVIAAPIG